MAISNALNLESYHAGTLTPANTSILLVEENSISLPPFCPNCDPSYNIFPLNSYRALIALDEKLISILFVGKPDCTIVYSQAIDMPECSPLVLFKPHHFDVQGFVHLLCSSTSEEKVYFIGDVTVSDTSVDFRRHVEVYREAGEFHTYSDAAYGTMDTYFLHAERDTLYAESLEGGDTMTFNLPENCTRVVRMTSLGYQNGGVLVECSGSAGESQPTIINSIHLLYFERDDFAAVLTNLDYELCPLRLTLNGSIVAVFTQSTLILIRPKVRKAVFIKAGGVIHDGQLSEFDDKVIAVYSTPEGLYGLDVGVALGRGAFGSPSPLRLDGSGDFCTQSETGCSLLHAFGRGKVVAVSQHKLAVFSLDSLGLLNTAVTKHRPSRIFFHGVASPSSDLPPSPAPTAVPTTPHPQTPSSDRPTGPEQTNDKNKKISHKLGGGIGGGGAGLLLVVALLVIITIAVICALKRSRVGLMEYCRLAQPAEPDMEMADVVPGTVPPRFISNQPIGHNADPVGGACVGETTTVPVAVSDRHQLPNNSRVMVSGSS